jgi:opacity protein-like surface antigen
MLRPIPALLAAALVAALMSPATAADRASVGRSRSADGIVGEVTAESRYGNGQTVTAPVRRNTKDRLEVRLPGGTWIECVRSCSETLRRQTVDFWQNYGGAGNLNGGEDGPGYFRFRRP